MIHDGPIPWFVHAALEYAVGGVLIAAPFIFGFSNLGAPTAVGVGFGVFVVLLAATTPSPTSVLRAVPIPLHALVDFALGGLFIASPFIFGYSGHGNPTAFFIGWGVLELLLLLATRYPRTERRWGRRP